MSHILIVDADKRLRTVYAQALQNAGFSVAQAASAQLAIAKCEKQQPALIILELQLQGHSGVEFLNELRSYPEWNDSLVLVHTMVPQSDLQNFNQAFTSFGIVGYAYKPATSLNQLVRLVDKSIGVKV